MLTVVGTLKEGRGRSGRTPAEIGPSAAGPEHAARFADRATGSKSNYVGLAMAARCVSVMETRCSPASQGHIHGLGSTGNSASAWKPIPVPEAGALRSSHAADQSRGWRFQRHPLPFRIRSGAARWRPPLRSPCRPLRPRAANQVSMAAFDAAGPDAVAPAEGYYTSVDRLPQFQSVTRCPPVPSRRRTDAGAIRRDRRGECGQKARQLPRQQPARGAAKPSVSIAAAGRGPSRRQPGAGGAEA